MGGDTNWERSEATTRRTGRTSMKHLNFAFYIYILHIFSNSFFHLLNYSFLSSVIFFFLCLSLLPWSLKLSVCQNTESLFLKTQAFSQ